MTKLDKLKQAEHMYVYDKQPLDVIGTKLDLSRRTLFYWKKEYEWDRKRFEKGREQELFNRELLNFAQKIIDKISNDIDNNQQTPQAEMYSLMNILKNLPQVKQQITEQKQNWSKIITLFNLRLIFFNMTSYYRNRKISI